MENKESNNKSALSNSRKEPEKKRKIKENFFAKSFKMIAQFLRDAKMEIKKVKWPTRKELLATTAMVLILVIIVGLFLGLVDHLLMMAIQAAI
jgi:preprotein translocase subunit SecE